MPNPYDKALKEKDDQILHLKSDRRNLLRRLRGIQAFCETHVDLKMLGDEDSNDYGLAINTEPYHWEIKEAEEYRILPPLSRINCLL